MSLIIIAFLTNDRSKSWVSKYLCKVSIIYSLPVQMHSHLGIPLRDAPDFSSEIPSFPFSSSGS